MSSASLSRGRTSQAPPSSSSSSSSLSSALPHHPFTPSGQIPTSPHPSYQLLCVCVCVCVLFVASFSHHILHTKDPHQHWLPVSQTSPWKLHGHRWWWRCFFSTTSQAQGQCVTCVFPCVASFVIEAYVILATLLHNLQSKVATSSAQSDLELELLYYRLLQATYLDVKV